MHIYFCLLMLLFLLRCGITARKVIVYFRSSSRIVWGEVGERLFLTVYEVLIALRSYLPF